MNEEDAVEAQIRENVHRRDLTAMDMAVGVRKLTDRGRTDTQIAAAYGQSIEWVGHMRQSLTLDKATKARVHSGETTVAGALAKREQISRASAS